MYAFLSLLKGKPRSKFLRCHLLCENKRNTHSPKVTAIPPPIQHFKQEDRNLAMFQMESPCVSTRSSCSFSDKTSSTSQAHIPSFTIASLTSPLTKQPLMPRDSLVRTSYRTIPP